MVKQLSRVLCALTLFVCIGFSQDVILTLDGGDLNYESSADIYGFQFDHAGCATSASGGDATDSGFIVQGSGTTVLGFSFSGGFVPAGSGTFLTGVDCDSIDNLIFSGAGGSPLVAELATSGEAPCDDVDADGICDDVDDCVGELDECGVCNGDGIADGACDCDGNVADCAGDCGGSASN